MGFSSTCKFVSLGLRTRVFRKFRGQPTKSYDWIRNYVDKLLRNGRIEVTLPRAKELQQYAEEVIYHAKRDTHESDLIVESVIRTPESRSLLYEKYVPLYKDRNFFFTRVVNQFKLRQRDSAPMAYLELVDRPNEIFPAKPVGKEKLRHILSLMKATRRDYRKYYNYAKKVGLLDADGKLVDDVEIDNKKAQLGGAMGLDSARRPYTFDLQQTIQWFETEGNISTVDENSLKDEDVRRRLETIRTVEREGETVKEAFETLYKPNTATVKKTLRFTP